MNTNADVQKKFCDNRNRKFKKLFIYKSEIQKMVNEGYSFRQIKKQFTKAHNTKISLGSLHSFIKNYIKNNSDN